MVSLSLPIIDWVEGRVDKIDEAGQKLFVNCPFLEAPTIISDTTVMSDLKLNKKNLNHTRSQKKGHISQQPDQQTYYLQLNELV